MKKRNAQDATLRNVRALKRENTELRRRVRLLEQNFQVLLRLYDDWKSRRKA